MTDLPRFEAVILDLDGLMVDTETPARQAWQQGARDLGREIDDALFASFIGRRNPDCAAALRKLWGDDFDFAALTARIAVHWRAQMEVRGIERKPGVVELLEYLRAQKMPRAVATSTFRPGALRKLGDLADYLDALVTGEEIVHGKPAPDIFLEAARRLGVAPAQCLVLEDSHTGVEAARAAGMTVVMVPDLLPPHLQAHHICASLHEVRAWLEGNQTKLPN